MAATHGRKGRPWRRLRQYILATTNTCSICGLPVDRTVHWNHPQAPTVDHRIPLSKGGAPHDPTNLTVAHRSCNSRKNNRTEQRTNLTW